MLKAFRAYSRHKPAKDGGPSAAPELDNNLAPNVLAGDLNAADVDHLWSVNEKLGLPILHIWPARWDVIIDINLKFRELRHYRGQAPSATPAGARRDTLFNVDPRLAAKRAVVRYITEAKRRCGVRDAAQRVDASKTELAGQYVFARLEARALVQLAQIDKANGEKQARIAAQALPPEPASTAAAGDPTLFRAVHQIWPDFDVQHCVHRSVRTVKADAAQNSFRAYGEGITWAVVDSGIDSRHPHFALHANIDATSPFHRDFTNAERASPLTDEKGHGTHVAGIIAGQQTDSTAPPPPQSPYEAQWRLQGVEYERDVVGSGAGTVVAGKALATIAGIAPKCKLVSLKVLDQFGNGKASNVIAAIAHIQLINGHGRDLKIHGVNLSLGHSFDAKWFACGHSPLCVEVNRLVKSGVVVVVAAGNTGYGVLKSLEGDRNSGLDLSINDPGNAELAITVGATHRDAPHRYGVSYFSSKGPTGDGRLKPDLIAPGERIISSAAADSAMAAEFGKSPAFAYCESSGTSMAAPHVSGAVAAFLSIRNEFIGEAEKVKKIFTSTATDLGRDRYFQGAGLVDLLRAIQSV